MNSSYRIITLLVVILLVAGCMVSSSRPPAAQPDPDYWPTQNWRISSPEAQGMDSARLVQMFENIQKLNINLHSLLIVRNGYLVVDAYFPPYAPDIRHTVESNTKSVIGTLIGIAIDQGKIKDTNQKLVEFFPERLIDNLDEKKKAITLGDLLAMTPGLDCADLTPAANDMYKTRAWVQYLLDLPMTSDPGKKWSYCSGAAHLLSAVLQQATGMDARTFANRYLFQPLGIPEVEVNDWGVDPQGVTNGIAGLYLTPRELAKFGFLYLNKGKWGGQQVVSEHWVEESTREHAYIGKDAYVGGLDRRFGYMFSIFPDLKYYGYLGMAGQELFVLPEKNLVVVFTASLVVGKEANLLALVNDYIGPSVQSNQPISSSNETAARLQSLVRPTADPKQPPAPLPQIAVDISGKTFVLDQNSLGWQSMTFFFQPGSDEAVLKMAEPPDLRIGMDNYYRFTETPNSRPVGLRGSWKATNEFYLEYITLGDFIEAVATIKFEADQIKISLTNLNFGDPPLLLHGGRS